MSISDVLYIGSGSEGMNQLNIFDKNMSEAHIL